jgi:hypothetical protein
VIRLPFKLLGRRDLQHAVLAVAHDLGVGLHDAHRQPAARRAERTHARLPLGDAGHELVFRNEADQLKLGIAAARERGARAGNRGQLDEISSLHIS